MQKVVVLLVRKCYEDNCIIFTSNFCHYVQVNLIASNLICK